MTPCLSVVATQGKKELLALAVVGQWIECWPVDQRVSGLIPTQGTYLGCGPGPQ